MKFRRDNKIIYGQDHSFFRGIPHGVDFRVERFCKDRFKLIADGYGCLKRGDHYGNGAIYPYPTKRQRDRFVRQLGSQDDEIN